MQTQRRRLFFPVRSLVSARLTIVAAAFLVSLFGATFPVVAQSSVESGAKAAVLETNATSPDASDKAATNESPVQAKLPQAPEQVTMPPAPPIRFVPGLAEPLVATGEVTDQENKDLDEATAAFKAAPAAADPEADFSDYAKPLVAFIDAHPNSSWNVALLTNLGLGYYHAGYYSRAFDAFGKAWQQGRDAGTTPQARLLVDRAVGELVRMHARLGHDKELEALLTDIHQRPLGGPATELVQGGRESLWMFHHNPGMSFLCGPLALQNILLTQKANVKQLKVAQDARSGTHGFTLEQLATLADKAKLKYNLILRKPGQPVPVPSIINWSNHHYATITGTQNGAYLLKDPTSGDGGAAVTVKAIDAESSGYFLVPKTAMDSKSGWKMVDAHSKEAKTIYGMGTTYTSVPGETRQNSVRMKNCVGCTATPTKVTEGCPTCNALPSVASPLNRAPGTPSAGQMTVADASAMVVSLRLEDTPVGYQPQKGISALTTVSYNQRESEQPAVFSFSNLSPKWSYGWLSYIQDDPVHPGVTVRRVTAGGGGYDYPGGYNTTTGYMPAEEIDMSQTFRLPVSGAATSYEHDLPDGSKELFTLSNGAATYPRLMFLTSVVDPAGNTTTLTYDASFRLTTVTDAMGRSITFSYGLTSYPLLITKITDAFGRFSQINYDSSQRLSSITDPIGITSTYTYSTTEPNFVTKLVTPYGTSTFLDSINVNDPIETNTRSLTLKDPLGFTDYLYFYQSGAGVITPPTDPANTIPAGLASTDNGLLEWRNTYYWDKHAFALGVTVDGSGNVTSEDFTKARLTHFLHDTLTFPGVSGVIGSVKPPLENRVWMNYTGQGADYLNGTLDRPIFVGRRLVDGGATQLMGMTYNSMGLPVTVTDPVGRVTKYTYATNNVDLLTVQQETNTVGPVFTTIATYGSYNTQHKPQTVTGQDGQTWHYTYTSAGQIKTVTNGSGIVNTYNYDASNRLSSILNAAFQTQVTLTYDSADRIQTRTDSEGYVLTYAYDNLDRVTKITYPDATTDLYDYTFQSGPLLGTPSLELRKHTDRLGRVTTLGYDADQRLTSVTEPITATTTRTTNYDYYENGTLKDIIDANGNDTNWQIDVESRPTSKTYAFGASQAKTETYAYETTTSRLLSITDALSQVKTFSYGNDDTTSGLTYTSSVNTTPNVTFAYDQYFPRLTSMVDSFGTTTYGYVPVGSYGGLELKTITPPFANSTLTASYDNLSRFQGYAVAGTNDIIGYDSLNRIQSHSTPMGVFSYTYLGQTNQVTGRSLTVGSNTFTTSWGYDTNTNDRRLLSITNSGVTRNYTLGYGTSPVNPYDIMSITDTAATGHPWATQSHAYTYDQSDRLLTASATAPGNFTYAYDPLDNQTTVTTPSGTTNPTYNHLNQIATWGTLSYVYDSDGNLLSGDGIKTYKWDAENRLIEIDYVGTSNKDVFAYDGFGHRIQNMHTVSGTTTTTYYNWCGSQICQTRNSGNNPASFMVTEGFANLSTGTQYLFAPDQLGSNRDVLNVATGVLTQSYEYAPYGSIARETVTPTVNYLYANLWLDNTSSLNLSATRPMDGVTGRWLNKDLLREAGGINLYGYGGANPISNNDPVGLRWIVAAAWSRDLVHQESVGHVVLAETNGEVLLSQFPDQALHPWGRNTPESWGDTLKSEKRNPSNVYNLWIPNDAAFDKEVAAQRARQTWSPAPLTNNQTNCTTSAYSALFAGGLPNLQLPTILPATPNDFIDEMNGLSKDPNNLVVPLSSVPW